MDGDMAFGEEDEEHQRPTMNRTELGESTHSRQLGVS